MRVWRLSFCLLTIPAAAVAEERQQAPDVLNRVYACSAVANASERLACFDTAVGRLRRAEQQGEFAGVDRAQAQAVERDSFGFQVPSLSRLMPGPGGAEREATDDVQMTVERVVARANGYHAFVMTNGQIWTQVQAERASNVRPGVNVTVRRAFAGSYMLSSERGGSAHRVRREQ